MTVARPHTRSSGSPADALGEAFRLSCELLQSRRSEIRGLAVHIKAQLEGTVPDVLGNELVKALDRNNRVQLKGITIQLLTVNTIIGCQGVTDVVFVPREPAELEAYKAAFPDSVPVIAASRWRAGTRRSEGLTQ